MIKINTILRELLLKNIEAYTALTEGYMNMSAYAESIHSIVESRTKKEVTINSLVVSLSRLKKEFKKVKPLIHQVAISNITSKLPLSEIIYENSNSIISKLESLHKKISVAPENFFTSTVGTSELNIVCSSSLSEKILKHFDIKPKFLTDNLAAIGISFDKKYFDMPNTLFSLIAILAREQINIVEIVSTYTELLFILKEKDFGRAISLFSAEYK